MRGVEHGMTQEQREELKRIQGMMDILYGCEGVTITKGMTSDFLSVAEQIEAMLEADGGGADC